MPWSEENFIFAKVGYHLIRRLSQDNLGRKTLSSPEGVFHVLGYTFVENQDNIFHHKKSFVQDIRDLLEREVRYIQYQKKMRISVRKADMLPEFGLRSSLNMNLEENDVRRTTSA